MIKRVALLVAAACLAVPAEAQEARIDPDHVMTVMKDAGYPAEFFNDDADYRQILSKTGNYQFLVEMYDCVDGKSCQTLEFYSNFPMEEKPTKQKLDAYSGARDGASISLDRRGDVVVRQELDIEGLADDQLVARLKGWETMITDFVAYLTAAPGSDDTAAAAASAAAEAATNAS
jgi:hypothetical protein